MTKFTVCMHRHYWDPVDVEVEAETAADAINQATARVNDLTAVPPTMTDVASVNILSVSVGDEEVDLGSSHDPKMPWSPRVVWPTGERRVV